MLHVRWRQHALLAVGAYAVLAVALSAVLLTLQTHTADLSGLQRRVYPGVGFAGEPLLDDFNPDVTLGFLDDDPALPRQFFSARWQGFWYVPEAGDYDIHGSGDDRLDVWIDGVLVIRRFPPSEMHTVVRTISLDAGLHDIGIGYEQHGGAHSLRLGWSLPGRRANPLPAHRLWVRLFFVGGRISLCGSEAGGNWIRHGVVREQRRGPVADGTCAVSDGWGCSAGTRALGGGSQYASMRRRPVAA